jgi:glycosidase
MRIILDFVPSHLSNENPIFKSAYKTPDAEFSDWFVWKNDAHTQYAGFADIAEMPRFNHFNPEVVDYLTQAALYWLDLDNDEDYSDGVDGFRIDNATFPPPEFFLALRQRIKAVNPNALLLGEAWVNNPSDLSRYFPDQFDALFDFPLYQQFQGDQSSNADGTLAGNGFPTLLSSLFVEEAENFSSEAIAVRFLSNHDTNRIVTEVEGDRSRQRLAAALLAALPGPVMVYYGEEIGMPGEKVDPQHGDNYRREPMDWYAAEVGEGQASWFMPEDRWNRPNDGISVEEQDIDADSLLNTYRHHLELRFEYPALLQGDFTLLELQGSEIGPWGFIRSDSNETIVAIYNFAGEERQVIVPEFPLTTAPLVNLLTGQEYPAGKAGSDYTLTLPPAGAVLLAEH